MSTQLTWLFFSLSGRLGRSPYFLGGLLLAIAQAFPLYRFMLVQEDSPQGQMWSLIFLLVFVAGLWCNVALAVKRLHDLSRPGILAISLFIPVLSIIAFLVLCLLRGDSGPNRYGERTNAPAGVR